MIDKDYKILIVDDEEDLCEILDFNLQSEGYSTEVAFSAEKALKKDLKSFDLILLDIMMEKMSGFKFAEKLRKELKISIPIIFITAKTEENDMITGFNLGGDDYITKPFSVKEVMLRVKAVLRRSSKELKENIKVMSYKDLEVDRTKRSASIGKKKLKLTKKEFEILALLLNNKETVFTRNEILNAVWEDTTIVTPRTVDVHIARLRKKLKKYGDLVKSKAGFGYTFEH